MGRSRVRWGLIAALALSATASACSSKNDIVATQRSTTLHGPDGSIFASMEPTPCEPGTYSGTLSANPGDAGVKVNYSGTLGFTITQSRSGEFLVTNDTAQLVGKGDDGSSFQALLEQGKCNEGVVESTLANGMYTFFTNADHTASLTIPFDGAIHGQYLAVFTGFAGAWTTALHLGGSYGDLIVQGTWSASRRH